MRWIKGNKSSVNLEYVMAFTIERTKDDIAISAVLNSMPDSLIRVHSGFTCEEAATNWVHKKLIE